MTTPTYKTSYNTATRNDGSTYQVKSVSSPELDSMNDFDDILRAGGTNLDYLQSRGFGQLLVARGGSLAPVSKGEDFGQAAGTGLSTPAEVEASQKTQDASQAKINYDIATQGSPYASSEDDTKRFQTALTNLRATGQEPPTTQGPASSAIQNVLPPSPQSANTSLINTTLQADTGLQTLLQNVQQYMSPQNQQQTLTQEYTKLLETSGIQGINTQLLNAKKVIEGTTDDIRNEITKAGGFATESQVQALSIARNKSLVQNYNNLLNQKAQIQDQVNMMIGLSEKDRTAASAQMNKNAQETYNNLVENLGYNGLYQATGGDPYYTSLVEESLGLAPGGLQQLAQQQDYEQQVAQQREEIKANLENQVKMAELSLAQAATKKSLAETGGIAQKQYLDAQESLAAIQKAELDIKKLEQEIANAPTKLAQDKLKADLENKKLEADIAYTKAKTAGEQPTGISSTTQAIIDNPSLFDDLTPTEKGKVITQLQTNKYDTSNLGVKGLSDTAIQNVAQTQKALDDLAYLKTKIQGNESKLGPIKGLAALNPWSEARKLQADVDRVRQTVGKALEGGVLRKEDEEKYKKILATLTDTPTTALYKVDALIGSITI